MIFTCWRGNNYIVVYVRLDRNMLVLCPYHDHTVFIMCYPPSHLTPSTIVLSAHRFNLLLMVCCDNVSGSECMEGTGHLEADWITPCPWKLHGVGFHFLLLIADLFYKVQWWVGIKRSKVHCIALYVLQKLHACNGTKQAFVHQVICLWFKVSWKGLLGFHYDIRTCNIKLLVFLKIKSGGRRSPAVACWASDHWVASSNPLWGKFCH